MFRCKCTVCTAHCHWLCLCGVRSRCVVRFRHRLMVEWVGEWHCTVTADTRFASAVPYNMLCLIARTHIPRPSQKKKTTQVCNRAQIFALLDELYYHKFVVLSNCDNIMFSWLDSLAVVFTCLILITWSDASVSAWFFSETNKNLHAIVLNCASDNECTMDTRMQSISSGEWSFFSSSYIGKKIYGLLFAACASACSFIYLLLLSSLQFWWIHRFFVEIWVSD